MTPNEITEAYLKTAVGNGWDLEQWYRDNIAPIIICPCRENSLIKEVASILIDSKLYKLLFTDIPFAKAVWGEQEIEIRTYTSYNIEGNEIEQRELKQPNWQYKLQQLIIQPPEDWWDWLEKNMPNEKR